VTTFPGVVQIFNESHEEIGSSVFSGELFDLGGEFINPLIDLQLLKLGTGNPIDIVQFFDPLTGQIVDPLTGQVIDMLELSTQYQLVNSATEELLDINQFIDPTTGQIIDPATGQIIDILQFIDHTNNNNLHLLETPIISAKFYLAYQASCISKQWQAKLIKK
jgi:hypothetical protein